MEGANKIEERALGLLSAHEVIVPGHFVGTKGGHMDAYVQKDKTIADAYLLREVTELMAWKAFNNYDPGDIDTLVGIAPCSSQLATRMAEHLGEKWKMAPDVAFAEKVPSLGTFMNGSREVPVIEEKLQFKRGFGKRLIGKRVLLIEDVLNTAGSLVDLRDLTSSIEGIDIKGAIVEFNRSPSKNTSESLGMPLHALVSQEMLNHQPDDCPMCRQGIPVNTNLGHGGKFLEEQAQKQ